MGEYTTKQWMILMVCMNIRIKCRKQHSTTDRLVFYATASTFSASVTSLLSAFSVSASSLAFFSGEMALSGFPPSDFLF